MSFFIVFNLIFQLAERYVYAKYRSAVSLTIIDTFLRPFPAGLFGSCVYVVHPPLCTSLAHCCVSSWIFSHHIWPWYSARLLYISMMENHKFHRPEANGARTTRSRVTDILSKITSPRSPPNHSGQPNNGQVALRDRSSRRDRHGDEKERRSSAPPNVINGISNAPPAVCVNLKRIYFYLCLMGRVGGEVVVSRIFFCIFFSCGNLRPIKYQDLSWYIYKYKSVTNVEVIASKILLKRERERKRALLVERTILSFDPPHGRRCLFS